MFPNSLSKHHLCSSDLSLVCMSSDFFCFICQTARSNRGFMQCNQAQRKGEGQVDRRMKNNPPKLKMA